MSTHPTAEYFEGRGCLPEQAGFAATFFAPDAPRMVALVSPVATGKGFTAAEICNHAVTSGVARRVLVVTDRRALAMQFEELLRGRNCDLPVTTVDRQKYWELEAGVSPGDNVWPASGVVIVPAAVFAHEDVRAGLAMNPWELIVLDGVGSPEKESGRTILQFAADCRTARVLSLSRQAPLDILEAGKSGGLPTAVLSAETAGGNVLSQFASGQQLLCYFMSQATALSAGPRSIRWLGYTRNEDERALLTRLQASLVDFDGPATARLTAVMLCRAASSCPYSLDYAIRRLRHERNAFVHGRKPLEEDDDVSATLALVDRLRDIPTLIEAVAADSKTAELCKAIEGISAHTDGAVRACVYTRFQSSVDYLKSALEPRFGYVTALTSRMSFEERARAAKDCAAANGILVLTAAVTTEPPATPLVALYDLPSTPAILSSRLAMFSKARGGSTPDVVAFEDTTETLRLEVVERQAFKAGRRPDDAEILKAVSPASPSPQ